MGHVLVESPSRILSRMYYWSPKWNFYPKHISAWSSKFHSISVVQNVYFLSRVVKLTLLRALLLTYSKNSALSSLNPFFSLWTSKNKMQHDIASHFSSESFSFHSPKLMSTVYSRSWEMNSLFHVLGSNLSPHTKSTCTSINECVRTKRFPSNKMYYSRKYIIM